jgi:hypothetical protein
VALVIAVVAHCVGTEPRCGSGIPEPFDHYARLLCGLELGNRVVWLSGAVVGMTKFKIQHGNCAFGFDGAIYKSPGSHCP